MSNPEPEGGFRDRLVRDGFRRHVHAALTAIGWFGPVGPVDRRLPNVTWVTDRYDDDEAIPPNTLVCAFEDHDVDDIEIGSGASVNRMEVWLEFYAVEDALGQDMAGDLIAILRGQRPAVNCVDPSFPVVDVDGVTELFVVAIDGVRGIHDRNPKRISDRFYYGVVAYLEDERP